MYDLEPLKINSSSNICLESDEDRANRLEEEIAEIDDFTKSVHKLRSYNYMEPLATILGRMAVSRVDKSQTLVSIRGKLAKDIEETKG